MTDTPRFLPTMTQHSIYFIIFPGFQLLDVSGPLQVFSAANEIMSVQGKNAFYQTALIASDPGVVTSSDGVEINVRRFPRVPGGKMNTVFLPGGPGLWRPGKKSSESELLDIVGWVRKSEAHIGRLASVCTGAFLLARTGLLDGRRVATHWAACDDLQRQYPELGRCDGRHRYGTEHGRGRCGCKDRDGCCQATGGFLSPSRRSVAVQQRLAGTIHQRQSDLAPACMDKCESAPSFQRAGHG